MNESPLMKALVQRRYLVLLGLSAFLYVSFLGLRELWYPDEPCVGEVAKAMFESGDWIVPRRMGNQWVDYWPMLFWAGCSSSFLLGGLSEFALRLPSALAGIVTVLATCAVVSRWISPRAGFWAGFALLTFHQFVDNATAYRPDMLFSGFIIVGMFSYALGAGERVRWWPRIGGFALLGCAVLVKGPLGLLLPGLVLTLWHLSRREWTRIVAMAPLTLVALAVALPWAFLCADAAGEEWFWGEVWTQNFARFEDDVGRGHIHPVHYYLSRLIWNLAPWAFLLPPALWWIWKSPLRRDRHVQLALWWFGTFLVFLSIAETKREMYMIPAYGGIALLLGAYLGPMGRDEEGAPGERLPRIYARVFAGLLVVVGTLLMMLDALKWPAIEHFDLVQAASIDGAQLEALSNLDWLLGLTGLVALVVGLWIWRGSRAVDPQLGLARLGLGVIGVYAMYWGLVLPATAPFKEYGPSATWIRSHIGDEPRIAMFFPYRGWLKREAFAYYGDLKCDLLGEGPRSPEELRDEDRVAEVARFLEAHPGSIVLMEAKAAETYGFFDDPAVDWSERIVRELPTGGRLYYVIQ